MDVKKEEKPRPDPWFEMGPYGAERLGPYGWLLVAVLAAAFVGTMVGLGVLFGLQSLGAEEEQIGKAPWFLGLGAGIGTLAVLLAILRGKKS